MKITMWSMGQVALLFGTMTVMWSAAESESATIDSWSGGIAAGSADGGALTSSESIARVRSDGFVPLSRPVQRDGVYVLFVLDRHYQDAKLTVDAGGGHAIASARLAGTRFGGRGFAGYDVFSGFRRPPVPPADIPNVGSARSNPSARRSPPLPRTRPDAVTAPAKEIAPQAIGAPRAATGPTGSAPSALSMPPVAPLE